MIKCKFNEEISSFDVPVTFPSSLLNEINQYGYIGSPSSPISLKSSFISKEGSKILLTWKQLLPFLNDEQKINDNRNNIQKFIIQKGIADILPNKNNDNILESRVLNNDNISQNIISNSILTASVPASISVDRNDSTTTTTTTNNNNNNYNSENDNDNEKNGISSGFINFEVISEIIFDCSSTSTTLLNSIPSSISNLTEECNSISLKSNKQNKIIQISNNSSSTQTLGIPPLPGTENINISENYESKEQNQQINQEENDAETLLQNDSNLNKISTNTLLSKRTKIIEKKYSHHSFEFDAIEHPSKLLYFRVQSINQDGINFSFFYFINLFIN